MKTMLVFISVTCRPGTRHIYSCLLKNASHRPSDSRYVNGMFRFLRYDFFNDESMVNQRCRDGDANKRFVDRWLVYIWGLEDGNLQGLPPNYIEAYYISYPSLMIHFGHLKLEMTFNFRMAFFSDTFALGLHLKKRSRCTNFNILTTA